VVAARVRLAERCPAISLGDVWDNVHTYAQATVVDLRPIDDDAIGEFPWPMVTFESRSGSRCEWGAPALIDRKRRRKGRGRTWNPPAQPVAISVAQKRQLDRESREAARKATAELQRAIDRRKPKTKVRKGR
jgi:hypothetical protein